MDEEELRSEIVGIRVTHLILDAKIEATVRLLIKFMEASGAGATSGQSLLDEFNALKAELLQRTLMEFEDDDPAFAAELQARLDEAEEEDGGKADGVK